MKVVPAPGCVLIEPMESDTVIQSADRNYDRMGKVLSSNSTNAEAGDIIFFDEYAYRRFTYQDKDYVFVDVSHDGLWAVLKPDGTDTTPSQVPQEGISSQVSPDSGVPDGS